MLLRALAILTALIAASLLLTWHFGAEIVLALGLILSQIKFIAGKIADLQLPAALLWLKTQFALFFRVELFKKYLYSTLLPVALGAGLRRRMSGLVAGLKARTRARYEAMMGWYQSLDRPIRVIATLIVVIGALALSAASLGLWLVLFSVQLPFWILALASTTARSLLRSMGSYVFKTAMFLQLGWLWRLLRRRLPPAYLERKRRFDFRLVRRVVRQRRMTLKQLERGGISLRLALLRAYLRTAKPKPPTRAERDALRSPPGKRGPR